MSCANKVKTTMAQASSFLHLKGKVVIITGASAGIGEATALEFARQGSSLMLCGRDQERLKNVSAKCREIGDKDIKIEMAIGDIVEASVQRKLIDDTISAFGRLDILINNAGMNIVRDALTARREDYDQLMRTNLESVFFLTQLAIPHLKKSKGNVVNVSSITSQFPMHKAVVYSMTKAALDCYTAALAIELAPFGVRVNSVNPGSVASLIYRRGQEALTDEQYDTFIKNQSSSALHPLGRMVLASEVADSIVFLASERASFLSGQIIFVDGGRHCQGPQPKL